MESIYSHKNELNTDLFPVDKGQGLRSKRISEIVRILKELEKKYKFRYGELRRLARSQLFILLKKLSCNRSSGLYLGEIDKLIKFELQIEGQKQNGA